MKEQIEKYTQALEILRLKMEELNAIKPVSTNELAHICAAMKDIATAMEQISKPLAVMITTEMMSGIHKIAEENETSSILKIFNHRN